MSFREVRVPPKTLVFAGGQRYPSERGVVMEMEVGNGGGGGGAGKGLRWKWMARVVKGLTTPIILGRDWLRAGRSIVDYQSHTLTVRRRPPFHQMGSARGATVAGMGEIQLLPEGGQLAMIGRAHV